MTIEQTNLILIIIAAVYGIVYLALVAMGSVHDKRIWKEESKVSTLSMDIAMFCMFWPLTLWYLLPKYLKNKEHYKYGIPFNELI